MNPLGVHIDGCEICQTARRHQQPMIDQIVKETQGKVQRPLIPCDDCGKDQAGIMFYLHDDLWEQVSRGEDPLILCVLCAEKRLGRRLALTDLQDIPVNAPWVYAIGRYGK
jgi:hypothetical protein